MMDSASFTLIHSHYNRCQNNRSRPMCRLIFFFLRFRTLPNYRFGCLLYCLVYCIFWLQNLFIASLWHVLVDLMVISEACFCRYQAEVSRTNPLLSQRGEVTLHGATLCLSPVWQKYMWYLISSPCPFALSSPAPHTPTSLKNSNRFGWKATS